MAAAAALNAVRQIQALADGPQTDQMRACLAQVANPLLAFLDHPDSRVRLGAARALLKLSRGYSDEVAKLDLSRAKSTLSRCRATLAEGSGGAELQEMQELLAELLGEEAVAVADTVASGSGDTSAEEALATAHAAPAVTASSSSSAAAASTESRGEVVLKVSGASHDAIRTKVMTITGVISVTSEGDFVIVSTRTQSIAADEGLHKDLLQTVQSEDPAATLSIGSVAGGGMEVATPVAERADADAMDGEEPSPGDDEDGAMPVYLDDEEDFAAPPPLGGTGNVGGVQFGASPLSGQANWSFFSQNNWMTGRKVQEFDDDPTIAARLAKAKQREQQRREEEKSRIGGFLSRLRSRG